MNSLFLSCGVEFVTTTSNPSFLRTTSRVRLLGPSGHSDTTLERRYLHVQAHSFEVNGVDELILRDVRVFTATEAGVLEGQDLLLRDGRIAAFTCNPRVVDFDDAGHWVHHDRFEDFVKLVDAFVA